MRFIKSSFGTAARGSGMALLAVLAMAGSTAAQSQGDRAAGQRIAETWCRNCHVVGNTGPGSANDAAPSFSSIAGMPSTTAMSLRAFLLAPHVSMPDYQFARGEMDDVIAYLLSLRGQ